MCVCVHCRLAQIPLLTPKMCEPRAEPSLAAVTSHIAKHWPSDFCWSSSFEPSFIALLMYEGYLPTAHGPVEGPVEYILLPKLHQERCIVVFEDLHVPRNVRSNSRDYQLSVDMAFDEVVEKCLAQHGESWLHPPIVDGFKQLFRSGGTQGVKMHSIEVCRQGELVAGELGYSIGKTYCSLSGFTAVAGAGSVQCLGLALLLHERGFDFWDLGMGMQYKAKMGAQDIVRLDFLRRLHASRDLQCCDLSLPAVDASSFLVPRYRIGCYVRISRAHAKHGGKIGTVSGYAGVLYHVQVEDGSGAKCRLVLRLEQLGEVCEDLSTQSVECKRADGSVVLPGLSGLPCLCRRPPGWTRCRRRRPQGSACADKSAGRAAVQTADTSSDVDMQASPSVADAQHRTEAREEALGQAPHACASAQVSTATSNAEKIDEDSEQSDEVWQRRRSHHVRWLAAAQRRRTIRSFLLQVLESREGRQTLSKRGGRTLAKLRAISSSR